MEPFSREVEYEYLIFSRQIQVLERITCEFVAILHADRFFLLLNMMTDVI